MKYVYLSPHLDDAVLSCGGAIHRLTAGGEQVLVISIFAGQHEGDSLSPFALLQHEYWGKPPRPVALRRAEDQAALALLCTERRHLDYLDSVYRASPDGQWLYTTEESLWGGLHPSDPLAQHGASALADRLAGIIPPKDQVTLYAPLGAGRHVDHQITHLAARHLLESGYRLAFYEDYPYAEKGGATELALATAGAETWRMEAVPLTERDLTAKVSALGYYRSQLPVLFGGAEAMPNRVWAFAASRTAQVRLAERVWWPSQT